jgi:hypothetical protein
MRTFVLCMYVFIPINHSLVLTYRDQHSPVFPDWFSFLMYSLLFVFIVVTNEQQRRYHEAVIQIDSSWEEKEKDVGQLNHPEFVAFLCQVATSLPLADSGVAADQVEAFAKLLHQGVAANPKHDLYALAVKPEGPVPTAPLKVLPLVPTPIPHQ